MCDKMSQVWGSDPYSSFLFFLLHHRYPRLVMDVVAVQENGLFYENMDCDFDSACKISFRPTKMRTKSKCWFGMGQADTMR